MVCFILVECYIYGYVYKVRVPELPQSKQKRIPKGILSVLEEPKDLDATYFSNIPSLTMLSFCYDDILFSIIALVPSASTGIINS